MKNQILLKDIVIDKNIEYEETYNPHTLFIIQLISRLKTYKCN